MQATKIPRHGCASYSALDTSVNKIYLYSSITEAFTTVRLKIFLWVKSCLYGMMRNIRNISVSQMKLLTCQLCLVKVGVSSYCNSEIAHGN